MALITNFYANKVVSRRRGPSRSWVFAWLGDASWARHRTVSSSTDTKYKYRRRPNGPGKTTDRFGHGGFR